MSKVVVLLSLSTLALAASTAYFMSRAVPPRTAAMNQECPPGELREDLLDEVTRKKSPEVEPVAQSTATTPAAETLTARFERIHAAPLAPDRNLATEILYGVTQFQLLQDPKYRVAMRELQKQNSLGMYADRISALQISPRVAEQLAQLLAEHSLQWMDESERRVIENRRAEPRVDPNTPSIAAMNAQSREQRRQAEIEGLLGADKYREWIEFDRTRSARNEVAMIAGVFEGSGEQLRADQRKALVKAVADELTRTKSADGGAARRGFGRPAVSSENTDDNLRANLAVLKRNLSSIEESNERLRRAAASFLSPQQLSIYEATLERRLRRARATMDVSRAAVESIGRTDLLNEH
jgi:hypothetical protein